MLIQGALVTGPDDRCGRPACRRPRTAAADAGLPESRASAPAVKGYLRDRTDSASRFERILWPSTQVVNLLLAVIEPIARRMRCAAVGAAPCGRARLKISISLTQRHSTRPGLLPGVDPHASTRILAKYQTPSNKTGHCSGHLDTLPDGGFPTYRGTAVPDAGPAAKSHTHPSFRLPQESPPWHGSQAPGSAAACRRARR